MKVYLYHMETKEYIGPCDAPLDPLETELQGHDIYLMPSNATTKDPGAIPEKHVAKWSGDAWEILEDHRNDKASGIGGTAYWTSEDHYYSPPRYMQELGPLPDGALLTAPEMTVEEAQAVSEQQYQYAQQQIALEMVPIIAEQLVGTQSRATVMTLAANVPEDDAATDLTASNPLQALLDKYNRNKELLQTVKQSEDVADIKATKYS